MIRLFRQHSQKMCISPPYLNAKQVEDILYHSSSKEENTATLPNFITFGHNFMSLSAGFEVITSVFIMIKIKSFIEN